MWRKWWFWVGLVVVTIVVGLGIAASVLSRRLEPFVREQTIRYLRERFQAEVEIGTLDASLPMQSPWQVLLARGRGGRVRVSGDSIRLRHVARPDLPPLIALRRFEFELDLDTLWNPPVNVRHVKLHGFALTIPPKGERPVFTQPEGSETHSSASVRIQEVIADGSLLTLLPKKADKAPLVFDLHKLRLFDLGPNRAMGYSAILTNAKPPGTISSSGTFGPWVAQEPSSTPLTGDYTFENANLGVFKGIAGTLSSTGRFEGILDRIVVDGTTRTPDFRLTMSGNRVPLETKFHAIVDGTNGDTTLDPVEAVLSRTAFECRGAVARNKDEIGKTVALAVTLRRGTIEDLLTLAMKGNKPILRGGVKLDMKFELPPGTGEIADRLKLKGKFALRDARFTSATVQDQIDSLSRRGQGRPTDAAIDEVPSDLEGEFAMERGRIDFSRLRFIVPGSEVQLAGSYTFENETLDFHGKLRLTARVSQTQTGWKRWVLKPVDPFFAKEGAGTLLKIAVTGTRASPKFGLDRGRKE
jgi:hypothetical protein